MATAVLSWAGKSFASGIVGAAGGMAFTNFLDYVGVTQPTTQILAKLDAMSDLLKGMAIGIGQLDARVEELYGELKISTLEIKEQIQKTGMNDALANIHAYTVVPKAQTPLRAKQAQLLKAEAEEQIITSTAQVLAMAARGEQVDPKALKKFFSDVLRKSGVAQSVEIIKLGLVGRAYGEGLLEVQTNLSITKMGTGDWDPNLFDHYEALEQSFLSYLATQMAGVHLLMAAKCHGAPAGTISTEAARYMWEDFVPKMLEPELERFLWCAEKLVCSQGQWRSPWPIPGNGTYPDSISKRLRLAGGLGAPPDTDRVLLRSAMIATRLSETFRDLRNPDQRRLDQTTPEHRTAGIYVHTLCRETDVTNSQGPELKPWPQGGSKGKALRPSGTLTPHWNGATATGYPKLAESGKSRLRLVRYFWPYLDVRGPVEQKFVDDKPWTSARLTPEQLENLDIDWAQVAHFVNLNPLLVPPKFTDPSKGVWKVSPLTGNDKYTSAKFTSSHLDKALMVPDANRAFFRAAFGLQGTQIFDASLGGPRMAECRMEAPLFSYESTEARKLNLHTWLSAGTNRNRYYNRGFHMSGRLIVNLKGPDGETQLYDSYAAPGGKMNLWDWAGGGDGIPQGQDESRLVTALTVGGRGKAEEYSLVVIGQVVHQGYCPGASAEINCAIKECSLSWVVERSTPPALKARKSPPARRHAKRR